MPTIAPNRWLDTGAQVVPTGIEEAMLGKRKLDIAALREAAAPR